MGYARTYGVCSELWGMLGTMGYARSYGYAWKELFSELWVILGTMGPVCFQMFPNLSDVSLPYLYSTQHTFSELKRYWCPVMQWTRVFGSKHWGLSTNFLGVPCWN